MTFLRSAALVAVLALLTNCSSAVSSGSSNSSASGDQGTGVPKGVDISEAAYAAAHGVSFQDTDGTAKEPLQIFADHGYTWARVRLMAGLDPSAAYNYGLVQDLDYVKSVALDVKAKGMKFLLDLHYSDYWADPGTQDTPAAWASATTLDAMATQVTAYTQSVMEALVAQGTPPDMVQIGNEVDGGMLWSLGKITASTAAGFAAFVTLEKAAVAGLEAGRGSSALPVILIHTARLSTKSSATVVKWYQNLAAAGGVFDAIGLSYYPMWHGSQTLLGDTIRALRSDATLGSKPVWVAETAYYWTTNAEGYTGSDLLPYDQTPAGQKAFLKATRATVTSAGGAGVFCWGAAWVQPTKWLTAADTSGWQAPLRRALFDTKAVAQIGIDF